MALGVGRGRTRPVALAGVVALAVGGVLVAWGLAGSGDGERGLRAARATAVNADRPGLNAHNSPAAAAAPAGPGDGTAIVVADRIDTPSFSCSVHWSTDGALTWRPLALPRPPDAPNCFWPDVAFDDRGNLVVLATATGGRYNQPVGAWVQRYDGAEPDGPPVTVAPSEAFHAHLGAADGVLFVAWVQGQPENAEQPLGLLPPPNPIMLSRSTDGGRTWSEPVTVSEPDRLVVHPVIVAGPGDEVLVGALDLGDDRENYLALHQGQGGAPPDGRWRVVLWRSGDRGRTFGPAVAVEDDVVIPERVVVDLMGGPAFARADAGPVYATWDGGRGDERDVYVARSDDAGATWSEPVRLRRPGEQLLPAVGVAPDGRVDLVFYERRPGPGGATVEAATVEAVVASSGDSGRSFDMVVVSERPFDAAIGLASAQGLPQRGNQLAILSRPDRILAFWGDASGGTVDNNVQDLMVGVVELDTSGRRSVAATAGAIVGGLGAVLLLSAAVRRPRHGAAR